LKDANLETLDDNINIFLIHRSIDGVAAAARIWVSIRGIGQTPKVVVEGTMRILVGIVDPHCVFGVFRTGDWEGAVKRSNKGESGCNRRICSYDRDSP
jgi:hypothetical protein